MLNTLPEIFLEKGFEPRFHMHMCWTTTLYNFIGTRFQANGTILQEDGFRLSTNKTVKLCWLMIKGPCPLGW